MHISGVLAVSYMSCVFELSYVWAMSVVCHRWCDCCMNQAYISGIWLSGNLDVGCVMCVDCVWCVSWVV